MKKAVVLLMFCFLGFISVQAQISQGGYPVSFNKSNAGLLQSTVPTQVMPVVDAQRLSAEDLVNDLNKEIPWRFGENILVDIDVKADGVTDVLPNGDRIYRVRVYSQGAFSINLTFDDYNLPQGAKLFIYNELKTQLLGAFTDFNNQDNRYFATTLIQGDAIIIEYFEPNNAQFSGTLHLSRVTHGYRNVLDFTAKAFGTSGTCNNNVVCPLGTGWDNEIRSVCMLVVGGSGFCTGALVNNTAQDGTPYVLTANHCSTANDFASWVFWFNWQSATCTNPGTSPAHDETTTSGSMLKARNAGSDFCLVQMNQTPPSTFNVYYAGWNYGATAATSTMCIHHPSGDIKKISSAGAATSVTYSGAQCWNVNWTSGVTEPGSSGSPLFDQNHRIIGQLYGGPSACGVAPGSMNDNYGQFAVSWNTGTTPVTRLVDWLDPATLNPTILNGFNPAPAVALDAKANSIIIPVSTYCTVQNIIPTVEILNAGTTNLISLTVRYHIDAGANVNQIWVGNLATNATAQVTFPQIALTMGTHRFYFSVTSPNGGTDLNTANDTLSIQYMVGGTTLPFVEGFEGVTFPPNFWSINNPDALTTWTSAATAGNGASTTSAFIDFFNYTATGQLDDLVSPVIDLTGQTNVSMTFNVAYRRYDATTNDGLDIYISTDCGVTFNPTPIYSKAGTALATGADDLNAFIPSVANDWRLETVNLTPYVGNNIVLQFQAVNAFGNNLYIDDINIISSTIPPVADFTQSDTTTCVGTITFTDLSTNAPTSWLWDFGDGNTSALQNPTHTYTASGYFTVSLTATNAYGNNTVTKTNLIHINLPTSPVTADVSRCGAGTVTLTATGSGILQWYDAATAGNYLGSGTSYTTPSITTTTPYYVENHIEQVSQYFGNTQSSTNGANYNSVTNEGWLVFDALTDFRLISVEVNASVAGNRLIELRDNAGTTIFSVTINIPTGVSRINLNFSIPAGTGYRLVGPTTANLWRSNTGTPYPYTLAGVASITGAATTGGTSTRYYFFFNWEVKLPDCISSRAVANAIITNGAVAGTASASPTSINSGNTSTITLTGSTGNIQWEQSSDGVTGWANVTGGIGATTASYTTAALTATTYYRALVSYAGCTNVYSNVVSVTVVPAGTLIANITSSANVSCNGASTGSATVTASGGTSPYNYIWSSGGTVATVNNLASGIYTVTVIDAAFNNATASITITQPAVLSSVATTSNASCFGGNNGSISLVVSGGTSPYTFLWSNTATTQNINNLIAGNYIVTVTDSHSCTATANATVTQPTLLSASISAQTNLTCNGVSTGSATVAATGGTGAYTYLWSNAITTPTNNNLAAGTYTVTVTDANACTGSATVTITQPAAISLTTGTTNATCGNSDGSATVTATGGTGAYTYLWSNAATTVTINAIAAGSYTVTVTDANACTATATANVSNTGGTSLTISGTNASCNGASTGSATVAATGGSSPYSYLWSTGGTGATENNLGAGNYSVSVTDNNGCIATASINITQPAAIALTTSVTDASCGSSNGSATVTATGGTGAYTYLWSNSATTATINNIAAGSYTATVTDANACAVLTSATVGNTGSPLLTISGTSTSCNGASTGSATVAATGGATPYTYLWTSGGMGATENNLAAGNYSVTVTDNNGCISTSSIIITQPTAITLSTGASNASCGSADGSAVIVASGGAGNYSYNWSNGGTTETINNLSAGIYHVTVTDINGCTATSFANVNNAGASALTITGTSISCHGASTGSATVATTGNAFPYTYLWSTGATATTINNLIAGTYFISVTDANGCIAIGSLLLSEPAALSASVSGNNVSCFGGSTGSAAVTVTGGTPDYAYLWSNGGITSGIQHLTSNVYSVTITDNNGCTSTASYTVTEPSQIVITPVVTNVSIVGGSDGAVNLTVSGGVLPYAYAWSNGMTTQNINNLTAGNYTLILIDGNGCTVNLTNTVLDGTTSVISAAIPFEFSVYPNPCKGLLNIIFTSEDTGNMNIKLTDVEGKTVYVNSVEKATSEFNKSLDLSKLTKGVYYLHIQTAKDSVHKLIVIQ